MTKRRDASSSSAGSTATAELKDSQPEPENQEPESDNLDNAALERCIKAWHRTFDLASIHPDDESLDLVGEEDEFASTHAAIAFREAMPPLVGYENIRDFIACATYGMLNGTLDWDESREFLAAAKIAIALLKAQPKSPAPPV